MKLSVEAACATTLALLSALLAFVPLFDVLGYEWSLAMALPAAVSGALVALARARRQRALAVAQLLAGAIMRAWLVLAPALAVIVANAARVRNCDLGTGLVWFALLPLASAAMGAALGVVVALARPWRGWWAPALVALAAIALSIVWGLIRFYRAPPITGYDPFVGWFAGSLYDEDVAPTRALLWSRLYQAAIATAALAACALFRDDAGSLRARAARGRRAPLLVTVAACALALALGSAHARLGFSLDGDDVARALGAERRTAHFVLHYSPTGPYARDMDAEALDVELRWAELERLFGRAPAAPVHAFLFDSPEQKRALIGAGDTVFAKAWRREIYVHWDGWPQLGFAHELAHVFAGVFGDPLLASSRDGVRFNGALIEGVAVAATWSLWEPWQPLTPHQTVRVLRDAGAVDDTTLSQVMGPGFFRFPLAQAYAVSGSFCRFLLQTRGIERLMQVYRAGGSAGSWRRVYGTDLATLTAEWRALVAAQTVTPPERALAMDWLMRPSVFARPCAHARAVQRRKARRADEAGDRAAALAAWKKLCATGDAEPRDLSSAIDAALLAGAHADARRLATELAGRRDVSDGTRALADAALGDVALLEGDAGAAATAYDRALARPLADDDARLTTLKRRVCDTPAGPARETVASVLVLAERAARGFDLGPLSSLAEREPRRTLYRYLLARLAYADHRFADVLTLLTPRADEEPLPDARFERERTLLVAAAAFRSGDVARARALFAGLAADGDADARTRRDAADWRDRCDFALTGAHH